MPYTFNWKYDIDSTLIFPDTNELYFPYVGIYHAGFHDANGCFFNGLEEAFIIIYELVVDTIHIMPIDTIVCPGEEIMLSAYSRGFGNHTWSVGEYSDSINYYTGVYPGLGYVSDYFIDTLTQSQYIKVTFSDENGCVTHDSVWVEVSHPVVDLSGTPNHLCSNGDYPLDVSDHTFTNPSGGVLYYYGPGMTWTGMFAPSSAGEYEIHSIYTDLNGCLAYDSIIVNVANPEPIILEVDTMMFTDSLYYILAPSGGDMLLGETALTETNEGYLVDASQYEPGYYTLHYEVVMGEYNCLSEFETVIHFIHRTNVREFNYEISIYPNPATTALNLSSTEEMDFTVSITDIAGKTIREERVLSIQHALDVSGLSPGIYLLRMQTPSGASKSVKFVKR